MVLVLSIDLYIAYLIISPHPSPPVRVNSVAIVMEAKKMTVIGDVDTVIIVCKLRKVCFADILSVGPNKEPEKKKEDCKTKLTNIICALRANYDPYYASGYYVISIIPKFMNLCSAH
ncbi:hypothetical protein MKW94_013844 [Papaver nudicaule]|uniref:Uncharacterized protein n=1 Tax=Papaver nudicaule TaxID=74823 RepID=A0AA41VII3_PAPNU|nr:hypothetical protein [Papaver nudicaule]